MKALSCLKEKGRFLIAFVVRRFSGRIWEECDAMIKSIYISNSLCGLELSEYEQGKLYAYKDIQYRIKRKCTVLKETIV